MSAANARAASTRPNTIASLLKMEAHFHPALHVEEEKYGDAILTAMPTRFIKAGPLPSVGGDARSDMGANRVGRHPFERAEYASWFAWH